MRVGLVGCVKSKARIAGPARDLYTSLLFRGRCAYVAWTCDRWFILSAKHGLVEPDVTIAPYNLSLLDASAAARRAWAASVVAQISEAVEIPGTTFEVHAGVAYRNFGLVDALQQLGGAVVVPAEGLSQGAQLAFYSRSAVVRPTAAVVVAAPGDSYGGVVKGSYAPLGDHLVAVNATLEQLSFAQVERILGRSLPASARRHRAWWANDATGSHSHARSWLESGWVVESVDLNTAMVQFRRGTK